MLRGVPCASMHDLTRPSDCQVMAWLGACPHEPNRRACSQEGKVMHVTLSKRLWCVFNHLGGRRLVSKGRVAHCWATSPERPFLETLVAHVVPARRGLSLAKRLLRHGVEPPPRARAEAT